MDTGIYLIHRGLAHTDALVKHIVPVDGRLLVVHDKPIVGCDEVLHEVIVRVKSFVGHAPEREARTRNHVRNETTAQQPKYPHTAHALLNRWILAPAAKHNFVATHVKERVCEYG